RLQLEERAPRLLVGNAPIVGLDRQLGADRAHDVGAELDLLDERLTAEHVVVTGTPSVLRAQSSGQRPWTQVCTSMHEARQRSSTSRAPGASSGARRRSSRRKPPAGGSRAAR